MHYFVQYSKGTVFLHQDVTNCGFRKLVRFVHFNTHQYIHLFGVGESGGYLPRRFVARQISTTFHLHLSEYNS